MLVLEKLGYFVRQGYIPQISEGAVRGQNTPTHNNLKVRSFRRPGPLRQERNLSVSCPITVYQNVTENEQERIEERVGTQKKGLDGYGCLECARHFRRY